MNCEQALVLISAALDGELTEAEKSELERHLDECPDCRAISEDFGVISVALSAMNAEAPADLIGRVNEQLDAEQPVTMTPGKVRSWRRWGSMVAMLAVVICLGGVYLFSGLGTGGMAKDAAEAPQVSAYVPGGVNAESDFAGAADMDAGEQAKGEEAMGYATNESIQFLPDEAPAGAPAMEAKLSETEAAAMVFDYLGGVERYSGALLSQDGIGYILERGEEDAATFETVLRYTGLSDNGCYYTFQTYRETVDDFVATFSAINHYAVKLDGSELLVERDETGSDNSAAFRAALSD